MFAFGVWDKEKEILTLSRDRTGEKPLFYFKNDDRFIFFEPLDENDLSEKMKIVLDLDTKNNFTEKSYKDSYVKFLRDMISDVYFSVR